MSPILAEWSAKNLRTTVDGVEVYSVPVAAHVLGVGAGRVRRLILKGRLLKVEGPRPYVTAESVLQYAQERKR